MVKTGKTTSCHPAKSQFAGWSGGRYGRAACFVVSAMRPEGLAVVFLAIEGSVSSEFRARMFHEFALNFVAPLGFKFSFDYHIFVCLVAH